MLVEKSKTQETQNRLLIQAVRGVRLPGRVNEGRRILFMSLE